MAQPPRHLPPWLTFDVGQKTMSEVRVIFPEENWVLVHFRQDGMPGVAMVNRGLMKLEPKTVFQWHFSMMIQLSDIVENGMPSQAERAIVDLFGEMLNKRIKGEEKKPNALFLARITWNSTRELIWRVYDPEPVDTFLKELIAEKSHHREFDYRIDLDPEWKLAEWLLAAGKGDP